MTRWTTEEYDAFQQRVRPPAPAVKPSKYRNQKVVINGEKFDSKREAAYYSELLLREKAGEVRNIHRQVSFHLCAPIVDAMMRQDDPPKIIYIAAYVADFTFEELTGDGTGAVAWKHITVDVKGARTPMFILKKKWLESQSGIQIREVR